MAKSGKLVVRRLYVHELTDQIIEDLWQIFSSGYEQIRHETFLSDLQEKTGVCIAYDSGDQSIQGFSTYKLYAHRYDGKVVSVLFSGDTMVNKEYWGQGSMHAALALEALRFKLKHPFRPLYYFMISMGYRTYLAIAKNLAGSCWPNHAAPTPAWEQGLIDSLSRARFGAAYKPESGLIVNDECAGTLKSTVAPIVGQVLELDEIKFFVKANPTYYLGHELACIARVDFSTFARLVLKFSMKTQHKKTAPSAELHVAR